jgi:hypothetical protein
MVDLEEGPRIYTVTDEITLPKFRPIASGAKTD